MHEHVKASQMLELLQSILDEEAEMFVLKMWIDVCAQMKMFSFSRRRMKLGRSYGEKRSLLEAEPTLGLIKFQYGHLIPKTKCWSVIEAKGEILVLLADS